MHQLPKVIVLSAILVLLRSQAAHAELPPARWPQFRGVGGAGVADEGTIVPREFGPDKNVLWSTPFPRGHSSPVIWDDRIYLTGADPASKILETICLDRTTGTVRWRQSVPADKAEPMHELNSPASSTPATDGERVYSYFGQFGLVCYDRDGRELWRRSLNPIPGRFGSAQSPIVAGEFVLLNTGPGSYTYALSAFDRKSGQPAWSKPRSRGFSQGLYSTPCVRPCPGGQEVLALGGQRVSACNLADGSERWYMLGLPAASLNSPAIADGFAVFTLSNPIGDSDNVVVLPTFDDALKKFDKNGDGKIQFDEIPADLMSFTRNRDDKIGDWLPVRERAARFDLDRDKALDRAEWQALLDEQARMTQTAVTTCYCVRLDGAGDVTATHVAWTQTKSAPEVPSPLIYQGRVYLVNERGFITCRDLKSGRELYRERLGTRGTCYASPVAGAGVVIAASDGGTVVVLQAGDKFKILSKVQFNEPILATPALVDGKIYLRTEKRLFALGQK